MPPERILIVTLDRFAHFVKEQIPELPEENILLEPYSRNTAPCIAWSTYEVLRRDPEAVVAVTPSDIMIQNEEAFCSTLERVLSYAQTHPLLLTLGVRPDNPETSYGYIQVTGGDKAIKEGEPVQIKTFVEKPSKGLAEVFCNSGEFLWNSGIFAWKASVIREEMEKYIPEITSLFNGWEKILGTPAEKVFIERAYTDCNRISIDYGVMEKTDRAWVCPVNFRWRDIDSWESLFGDTDLQDESGNISDVESIHTENCSGNIFITSGGNKLIAAKGLQDFVVVDTPDVLLICPKDEKKYREFITGFSRSEYEKYR